VRGKLEVREGEGAPPALSQAAPPRATPATAGAARADLSPAVRQLVKQHNLDVTQIKGTGRGGRITHEDVQNHLKGRAAGPAAPPEGGTKRVPHSPMRRRIAQHMVESLLKT